MEKLFRIPVLFFFIASCLGLFLRQHLFYPVGGVVFSNFLHAHSHLMFLGWVFNVLFLAYVKAHIVEGHQFIFRRLFWILQPLVVGMLISFPVQGYGFFSILFSTLHTFCVFAFIFLFLRHTRGQSLSLWLSRVSLIFFVIASLGPFMLAYLKANQLHHLNVYRFALYFYLHFQYNGFFFFGVLSLLSGFIEDDMPLRSKKQFRLSLRLFVVASIPAYFLSTLWAAPGMFFNYLGFAAALLQVVAIVMFTISVFCAPLLSHSGNGKFKIVLYLSYTALVIKIILQLVSSHPGIAVFAYEYRSIVIAYLHLVLVGLITVFLMGWLVQTQRFWTQAIVWAFAFLVTGFVCSELVLIFFPWIGNFSGYSSLVLYILSFMMVTGSGLFCYSFLITVYGITTEAST